MSRIKKKKPVKKPYPIDQTIQHALDKAEEFYSNNEIDQALSTLKEAEEKNPNDVNIAYQIGAYTLQKSTADGIKKLENTLDRFPNHLKTLLKLGDIHLKPGNITRAKKYFNKAFELYPTHPASHIGLGSLEQRQGYLPNAVKHFKKAIELQLQHPIPKKEPKPKEDFKVGEAEDLLWDTLKLMADNGVHMFPIAGTLLGLTRDGALFTHDKDIDTGIPYCEMERAIRIMQHNGWVEVNNSFGFTCPRAMLHLKSKITMDISGFIIDKDKGNAIGAGVWAPNIPKEWNILREFDEITLIKKSIPKKEGKAWYLKNPELWLTAMYGDSWRTPDKHYDTMIRSKNVRSFSYLLQCFSYARIYDSWVNNKIPLALGLVRSTLERDPENDLLKQVLQRLLEREQEIKI